MDGKQAVQIYNKSNLKGLRVAQMFATRILQRMSARLEGDSLQEALDIVLMAQVLSHKLLE